jgi:hypothetical protein
VRAEVRALANKHGIRDRRALKLQPPPEPQQLTLAV